MTAQAFLDIEQYRKPEIETGSNVRPRLDSNPPLPSHLPLLETLMDGEWRRLRRPIGLKVRREEDLVFVENETLGIFGHGHSLQTAVAEFRRDLEYYAKHYERLTENEVAGQGAKLKQVYAELF